MTWQQLHFICDQQHAPLCETLLFEEGALSVSLEDAGDEPIFEPPLGAEPLWSSVVVSAYFDNNQAIETLGATIATQVSAQRFWTSKLPDKDWVKEWLSHYKPIQCNERLWIVPNWLKPIDPSATNILIDPGLAFGTGYHASTRLCLDWLSTQDLTDATVLDYGCGSGILGIGALLLGATQVLAVDIDPQAITATRQNAEHNGVSERLTTFLPDQWQAFYQAHTPAIDTITANILAKPLIALAKPFADMARPHTSIVLAGLIKEQVSCVKDAYSPYFDLSDHFFDNPDDCHWYRLAGTRKKETL